MGAWRIVAIIGKGALVPLFALPWIASTVFLAMHLADLRTDLLVWMLALQWIARTAYYVGLLPILLFARSPSVGLHAVGAIAIYLALASVYDGTNMHYFRLQGDIYAGRAALHSFNVVGTPFLTAILLSLAVNLRSASAPEPAKKA